MTSTSSEITTDLTAFMDYMQSEQCGYALTNRPEDANVILFVDAWNAEKKSGDWIEVKSHPLFLEYPDKVRVYNSHDSPVPRYAGCYTSASSYLQSNATCIPVPYVHLQGHKSSFELPSFDDRKYMFSFIGSCGETWSPGFRVRRRIFELFTGDTDVFVHESDSPWVGKSDIGSLVSTSDGYREVLAQSKYVLCPRGYGNTTYRMYEAMQFGAIPIVIGDDWCRPEIISPKAFLQFSETCLDELISYRPGLLEIGATMQSSVRQNWNKLSAQDSRCQYVLECVMQTLPRGRHDVNFRISTVVRLQRKVRFLWSRYKIQHNFQRTVGRKSY